MITKENFQNVLKYLGFTEKSGVCIKKFSEFDCELKVDFKNQILIYPESNGLKINERQTCNFKDNENFVVFECVHKLLSQGYNPAHIELESKWQVGHGPSGGRADILVKDNDGKSLLIIECKTAGYEFKKAWNTTQSKPTQLFSYVQQTRTTKFIALYASDFIDGKVAPSYYLINLHDNEELLKSNPKLQSYKDASTVDEIYQVWSQTYEKDFATLGLFEDNQAYDIGKTHFTKDDLKNINSKDIQGKYHDFATILRQHNVSGRENAFDKLVNLFLCKVTDEKENPSELKFYWKGKAYDNPFDFQDRLQKLYKNGMEKFLGETITYIDNNQIDEAFRVFKNKPNATKEQIKRYFRELKFFTNNDFAFIDVHNEKLFYQNFEVLLKIARLIQDISLTGSDENQFLGDMFEGFLDQGVKQSEGQFFTPMPIVKFIINSLPQKQNPHVIDYACGAGHFLNEYASTCKDASIVGIEKEYRLSKVAKVSSFMYGSEIDIIYGDALAKSHKAKPSSFDVLIANPPYSVKGFLQTLSDEDRLSYELTETIDEKSYTANNAIECFFIERAKQLLATDAAAGIIAPSPILNKGSQSITTTKGNVYVRTREILLKYFDIIAIAEFGSGTFGKTGTNTVTLFLKRRSDNPNLSEHFANMVESWFACDFETNEAFEDSQLLRAYCLHVNVDFEHYKTLLCETPDEALFAHETFKEYKASYNKLNKTLKKKQTLIQYIRAIEKEKLYYFALSSKAQNEVIIVKSPSDNKENKKFLGYEWSSAKGNEGIHYLASAPVHVEDEALEEEDKRILENLTGLKYINTPLYNPQDTNDTTKINTLIKNNFEGLHVKIPNELQSYVTKAKLIDMIDFSRVEFTKAISLTPSKKVEIESKYPLIKLDDLVTLKAGGTPSRANASYWNNGTIKWLKINDFQDYQEIYSTDEKITQKALDETNLKLLPKDTIVVTIFATIGRVGILKEEMTTNQAIVGLTIKSEVINNYYLMYAIKFYVNFLLNQASGSAQLNINGTILKNMKIPLPPLEIQEEIVKECQKVDNEVTKAQETIEQTKQQISNEINAINNDTVKISDYFQTSAGGTPLTSKQEYYLNGTIPWVNSGEVKQGLILSSETKITQLGLDNSSAKIFPIDTVLVAMYGATTGEVGILGIEACTNQAVCGILPNAEKALPFYLYFYLRTKTNDFKKLSKGVARSNISQEVIRNFKIPLPPLETQKKIVATIEALEAKIAKAKAIIESAKEKKEAILKKYLSA